MSDDNYYPTPKAKVNESFESKAPKKTSKTLILLSIILVVVNGVFVLAQIKLPTESSSAGGEAGVEATLEGDRVIQASSPIHTETIARPRASRANSA